MLILSIIKRESGIRGENGSVYVMHKRKYADKIDAREKRARFQVGMRNSSAKYSRFGKITSAKAALF
jgi:hypothetical protein